MKTIVNNSLQMSITDPGDPSVGIFAQTWFIDVPFLANEDPENREFFRGKILELYQEFSESKLYSGFSDEPTNDDY